MPATGAVPEPPPSDGGGGAARRLWARFGTLVHELGKFGTVGSVAFAVDLAVFNLLLQLGSEPLAAKTVASLLAATVAFAGHRKWTWRHRERRHVAHEYMLFFAFNTVGLGIGLACLAISHYGLGAIWPALRSPLADNISGQLVGTALGTSFRFWSYRRFVFPDTPTSVAAPPAAGPPQLTAPPPAPPPAQRSTNR